METFQVIFWLAVLLGIPAAIIIFFIVALVRFCKTPKNHPERKARKIILIVSAVLLGLLMAGIALLAFLFTLDMNHM